MADEKHAVPEMVERVARAIHRAIYEARPTQNPCPYEEQDEPEVTLAMARAAIEAIRELPDGFFPVEVKTIGGPAADYFFWKAAIDKILKP